MHDDAALSWREVVEKHLNALAEEITSRHDAQIAQVRNAAAEAAASEKQLAAEQVERARRETAESFNQALRRMRQASSENQIFDLLTELSGPYCEKAVVLAITNGEASVKASRGAASNVVSPFSIQDAAAIGSAHASKDLVITFASASELSSGLAAALDAGEEQKAYLFPLLERQNVAAMLVALGNVKPAPLEILAEVAGVKLEALTAQAVPVLTPLPNPALVQIGNASSETSDAERKAWNELSPDDQKLHLQAQRIARVRVAEIRLYNADALRKGVLASDIYGSLTGEIDAARTEFLQTFLSKSPTMVDYLHLEILRSLAHDDDRLLGKGYPGPMV